MDADFFLGQVSHFSLDMSRESVQLLFCQTDVRTTD